jgi:hypothetical protein
MSPPRLDLREETARLDAISTLARTAAVNPRPPVGVNGSIT